MSYILNNRCLLFFIHFARTFTIKYMEQCVARGTFTVRVNLCKLHGNTAKTEKFPVGERDIQIHTHTRMDIHRIIYVADLLAYKITKKRMRVRLLSISKLSNKKLRVLCPFFSSSFSISISLFLTHTHTLAAHFSLCIAISRSLSISR